jgi:hypothetical protein
MSTQRWVTAPPESPARVVTKSLRMDEPPMTDSLSMLPRWLAACGHRPTAGPVLAWKGMSPGQSPIFSGLPV